MKQLQQGGRFGGRYANNETYKQISKYSGRGKHVGRRYANRQASRQFGKKEKANELISKHLEIYKGKIMRQVSIEIW